MRTTTTLLLLCSLHCASAQPGTVDTTFHSRLLTGSGEIRFVLALPDGKSMIGGSFTAYDGVSTGHIARLMSNGDLDTGFSSIAGFDDEVYCMVRLIDGRILVGGSFNTYNGVPIQRLVRLGADGDLDNSFQPEVSDLQGVRHIAVLPTGRILVSGYNLQDPPTGLRRLMPDGALDMSFSAPDGLRPNMFIALSDGRIMVGETKQTPPYHCLTRLLANGASDNTFTSYPFGMVGLSYTAVNAIHALPDDAYIIGGHFASYDGMPRKSLARILSDGALDPDYDPADVTWTMLPMWWAEVSSILPCEGDRLMIPKFGLNARLHDDGTLDETFHRAAASQGGDPRLAHITGSARQADGKILVAGSFEDIDSTGNAGIARLHDCVIGSPCDDGNPETTDDAVDPLCVCSGELSTAIATPTEPAYELTLLPGGAGSGRFIITGTFATDPGPLTVSVYDLIGKSVYEGRVAMSAGMMRIEVGLPQDTGSGIFMVTLTNERFRWTQRLHHL